MVTSTVGVFKSGTGLGIIIPQDIVKHYNLKPGQRIEIEIKEILNIPIKEKEKQDVSPGPEQSE